MGLYLARELQACNLRIYSDSQLVVNQVNDIYLARGERMAAYLEKANELMRAFSTTSIKVITLSKNASADALAKLALTRDAKLLDAMSVDFLAEPSIRQCPEIMELTQEPLWMDHIIAYLRNGKLPKGRTEARIL